MDELNTPLDTMPNPSHPPTARHLPFEFRGRAGEYFGIWIVNVLLSIITLGIYSAWAKVRRLRYFYGNTWLDGHNFEYHAKPKQILMGRLIVFGVLVVYNILVHFSPIFGILSFGFIFALPWVINKAVGFSARMTSYRNVRFGFQGSYWRAFRIFLLLPLLTIITVGLITPIYTRATSRYLYGNLRYGTARLETGIPLGALYGNFVLSIGLFVVLAILLIGLPIGTALLQHVNFDGFSPYLRTFSFSIFMGLYAALLIAGLFYHAGARNIVFNGLTLDGAHRFRSSLHRLGYCWMVVSNLLVTVLTLGLMRPWAAIRSWRYLTDRTSLIASTDLSEFVGQAGGDGNVVAAEYAEIELISFGF